MSSANSEQRRPRHRQSRRRPRQEAGATSAIIDGVSLQVREGETLCVVGESGSGKSVTSLTVMGLLQKGALVPSGGSVKLVGEELLTASDRAAAAIARHHAWR